MTLFALFVFFVFGLFHVFAYMFWLLYWVKNVVWLRIFKGMLVVNYLANLGYFLGRYEIPMPLWLYYLLSLSIGVSFVIFLSTLFTITLYGSLKIPFKKSRRERLKNTAALGGGLFMVSYTSAAAYEGYQRPEIVHVPLALRGLKEPFKAIQLSDLHIGGLIDQSYVELLVQEVNRIKPQAIFLTGDITDAPIPKIKDTIALLKGMEASLGCYYVVGNHEYFHDVLDAVNAISLAGIKPLLNESVLLGNGVNVVGVNDLFGYKIGLLEPDLKKALAHIDVDKPTILLAHQPKFAKDLLMMDDYPIDVVLSGHTHGGQIFPFSIFVIMQQGFLKGLYQINDRTQLYINRGTGFWGPPMRLGSRSEITVFEFLPMDG